MLGPTSSSRPRWEVYDELKHIGRIELIGLNFVFLKNGRYCLSNKPEINKKLDQLNRVFEDERMYKKCGSCGVQTKSKDVRNGRTVCEKCK